MIKVGVLSRISENEENFGEFTDLGEYEFEFLPRVSDWLEISHHGVTVRYRVEVVIHDASRPPSTRIVASFIEGPEGLAVEPW
jgi:hypothetical protein